MTNSRFRLALIAVVGACGFAATTTVIAQGAGAQETPREVLAVGGVVTPALEGGGPWLLAGAKANARLSKRFGFSVEAKRIWGSKNRFSEIAQSYTASMLIYSRRPADDPTTSYWFGGPQLFRGRKFGGDNLAVRSHVSSALSIGHGWSELTARNLRVAGEIGFSGGDGYMVFASCVIQFAAVR